MYSNCCQMHIPSNCSKGSPIYYSQFLLSVDSGECTSAGSRNTQGCQQAHFETCLETPVVADEDGCSSDNTRKILRAASLTVVPRDQGDRSLIFFSKLVTGTGAWVYPDACPRDYFLESQELSHHRILQMLQAVLQGRRCLTLRPCCRCDTVTL